MYHLLRFFLKLISYIPFRVLYVLSDGFFYLLYYFIRYRRKIVRKNLTESFPDKNSDEIKQIEKRFYHFFMDMILECCKLASISQENIMKHVKFKNIEIASSMLKQGKSVAVYIGHYGNWEWIPSLTMWCDNSRFAGGQIYRPLRNRCFDRLFLHLRTRFGTECIAKKDTLRVLLQHKRSGKPFVTGFMADQTPSPSNIHHWTMFMGMPTPVLTGYETLARKLDAVVVYIDVEILSRGYYKAVFKLMEEHPANNTDGFPVADRYMAAMEHTISRSPHAWLWTHKRWKHSHLFVNSTI